MDHNRKLGPLLILFLLFSLVPTIARADDWADPDAPEFWAEGAGTGQEVQQGGNFGYTPVPTVTTYNASIESSVYFDGANYIYIVPYGNYTWKQPGNLLTFTNFMGDRVIEQACFVLQYQSGTSWLALLPSEQQIYQVTDSYYGLRYNLTIKEKGQTYVVANVTIGFSVYGLIKPKISVSLNKTDSWVDPFGDPDFRWIWDIVPYVDSETGDGWKYWKNDTLVDVTSFEESVSIGNYSRIEFTDNTTHQIQSVLDVSDYGSINFDVGKTFWNSRGFVGIFPVNQGDIDPTTYSEVIASFAIGVDTTWTDYDLTTNQGVPKGAIAEIVCANKNVDFEREAGVRTDGSGLARFIDIHEAEGDGVTTATMLVKCDSSTGLIECYAEESDDIDYYLLGYFEGCDFTERFDDVPQGSANWNVDMDLSGYGVPANAVVQMHLANVNEDFSRLVGVREKGSGNDRAIDIDEAEDGGTCGISFFVKVDANSIILFRAQSVLSKFYLLGWFSNVVGFTEGWTEYSPVADDTWESKTIAEADASSIVVFALVNEDSGREEHNGLRPEGSALNRYIVEHESEGGGNSGFEACVTLDADKKAEVFCGDGSEANFYYTGFFSEIAAGEEYDRTATQSIGWSSSLSDTWSIVRQITQSLSWSSSLDRVLSVARTPALGVTWSSSLSRMWTTTRSISQGFTFIWNGYGLQTFPSMFSRTVSMGFTFVLDTVRTWSTSRASTLGVSWISSLDRMLSMIRTHTLGISWSSSLSRTWTIARSLSQGFTFVWNAYGSLGEYFSRTVSMAVSWSSSLDRVLSLSRTLTQGLTLTWNAYESLGEYFSRTVSMGLSFVWDAFRSWLSTAGWGFLDIHVTTLGGDPLENATASAWFSGENVTFTEFTNITGYIPQQNLTEGNYTLLVTLKNFLPYHHLFNISSNTLLEIVLQSVEDAITLNFNIELLIFASISMLFTFLALMGTPEKALIGSVGGFFTWFATGIWFLLSQEPNRVGFWYFFFLLGVGCLMLAYRNFLKMTFNRGKRGAWRDFE